MEKILFIRLRLLGDIIFTIPTLVIFKKHFPDTRISYMVEEKFSSIVDILPHVDEKIVVPRKMGFKKLCAFRKQMKAKGFATVIDMHSGPKSALLSRLTGIKKRVGYRTPNRNWAFTHLVPRKFGDAPTHSVFNQAKLLEPLGIPIKVIPPYPPIQLEDMPQLATLLDKQKDQKRIVLHIGSGNRFRDWGLDKFSSLISRLTCNNLFVYLIGNTEDEISRSAKLADSPHVHNMAGKLNITETLYLINKSHVYIGVDSGPLHVASLTGTPLIAIYGPNIPEISGPWRKENVHILQKNMDCRPCSQRNCIYDTIECMKQIGVDNVYEKVIQYIS